MSTLVEIVDGDAAVATVRIDGDVPGVFVVDVVARLDLAARRAGWTIRVDAASPDLVEILDLAGLTGLR